MDLTNDPRYDAIRRQYPPILSTAQVAEILQLDIRTVMKAVQLGHLKASRMPGARKWRFLLEDVIAMVEVNFTTRGAGDDEDEDDGPDDGPSGLAPVSAVPSPKPLAPTTPAAKTPAKNVRKIATAKTATAKTTAPATKRAKPTTKPT